MVWGVDLHNGNEIGVRSTSPNLKDYNHIKKTYKFKNSEVKRFWTGEFVKFIPFPKWFNKEDKE